MKRILLTSTALTMVAGIASADVSIAGSFKLGFNDTDSDAPAATPVTTHDNQLGVYNDAGITFAMSSTMDSGMTANITVDMNGGALGDTKNNAADAYTLALASDGLNVSFGSTEHSARSAWSAAGDMATDGWFNQNDAGGNVLKADVTVGGLAVSASATVANDTVNAAPDAVSIAVSGSLGGASYVIANEGSRMGISASTALGGATVTTAYSTSPSVTSAAAVTPVTYHASQTDSSTGISIKYPMGAITTTASYAMESKGAASTSTAKDSWNLAAVYAAGGTTVTLKTDESKGNSVEGTMTLGAATLSAGLADKLEDMYLAVSNPLGGGASIMASYAIDGSTSGDALDEIGAGDWQEGLTVELTFAF